MNPQRVDSGDDDVEDSEMSIIFTCVCENCKESYGVRVESFTEWYNLPAIHKCKASA